MYLCSVRLARDVNMARLNCTCILYPAGSERGGGSFSYRPNQLHVQSVVQRSNCCNPHIYIHRLSRVRNVVSFVGIS